MSPVPGIKQPDERSLASARLLIELVTHPLDPGYAATAQRRGPDAPPRRHDRPAVAAGCLLIGFVLVLAYVHTHRSAPETAKVHDSLVARVRTAQHGANDLGTRVRQLQEQLTDAQEQALPKSGAIAQQLDRAKLEAGQIAVSGPGLTVTLREPRKSATTAPPGRGGTTPIGTTNILTDRDVRSVVNELWRDGAEAIAVNNVRLTPSSAIRFAGEAVLVDFQPITSPYRIRALGNSDDLSTAFAQSTVASRYQTLIGVDGIGFTFADSGHLTLPAGAPVTLRYAKVPAKPKRGSK